MLESDPALCARALQLANSAYFGMSGQVTSVDQAVVNLGATAIRTLVVSTAAGVVRKSGRSPRRILGTLGFGRGRDRDRGPIVRGAARRRDLRGPAARSGNRASLSLRPCRLWLTHGVGGGRGTSLPRRRGPSLRRRPRDDRSRGARRVEAPAVDGRGAPHPPRRRRQGRREAGASPDRRRGARARGVRVAVVRARTRRRPGVGIRRARVARSLRSTRSCIERPKKPQHSRRCSRPTRELAGAAVGNDYGSTGSRTRTVVPTPTTESMAT